MLSNGQSLLKFMRFFPVFLFSVSANAASVDSKGELATSIHNAINPEKLTGLQIEETIRGKWITPDPDQNQTSFSFSEYFYADGTWRSLRQERTQKTITGRWSIIHNKLCVRQDTGEKICRHIYFHENPGRIISSDIGSGRLSSIKIVMIIHSI